MPTYLKTMKSKLPLFAAVLLLAVPAHAQHARTLTSGMGFLHECGPQVPNDNPVMRKLEEGGAAVTNTACNMYIFGIFEGIDSDADLLQGFDGKSHRFICAPPTTVAQDMRNVVVAFIQKNPNFYANFKTNRIASLALAAAFPCQTSAP